MRNNSRVDRKWCIPFVWLSAGFMSWFLSKFLFSYILSPILIKAVRETNADTQSVLLMNIVNMLFANMADFTLGFIFAMVLSFFTKSTKLRLLLFVFGAIAINLYFQVEGLIGYMGFYAEFPSWAITSSMQGFVSLLLIIPLCSIAGSKVGTWIQMKRQPS